MSTQDRELEALLGQAAPRAEPPADVRRRVLEAAEAEWRLHKRRRWRLPLALAASLLAVVAVGWLVSSNPPPQALITATRGLQVNGADSASGARVTLAARTELTALGSTRLLVGEGLELRLRGGTQLTWLAPGEVRLQQGALYVDTGGRANLRVRTPMGLVRDIGTTFMVTLEPGSMEVALRAGAVAVETDYGQYHAQARGPDGDVLRVGRQRIATDVEPASADRWQWIHDVHPGYTQHQVPSLLREIAEDLGMTLQFATPATAAAVQTLRMEGDLSGLAPEEALEVVLATNGLERGDSAPGELLVAIQPPGNRQ